MQAFILNILLKPITSKLEKIWENLFRRFWYSLKSMRICVISLVLIIVIGLIFRTRFFSFDKKIKITDWATMKKTQIEGKTFSNEKVLLDGFSYKNCTFESVTFIYQGDAPFELVNNTFVFPVHVEPQTLGLYGMASLMNELNEIKLKGLNQILRTSQKQSAVYRAPLAYVDKSSNVRLNLSFEGKNAPQLMKIENSTVVDAKGKVIEK